MKPALKFGAIALIAVIVVIVLFFAFKPSSDIDPEKYCDYDWDCSPDACCHAKGTVNNKYFPSCGGVICTAECVPGTIDCAQGELKCINHECTIIWNE